MQFFFWMGYGTTHMRTIYLTPLGHDGPYRASRFFVEPRPTRTPLPEDEDALVPKNFSYPLQLYRQNKDEANDTMVIMFEYKEADDSPRHGFAFSGGADHDHSNQFLTITVDDGSVTYSVDYEEVDEADVLALLERTHDGMLRQLMHNCAELLALEDGTDDARAPFHLEREGEDITISSPWTFEDREVLNILGDTQRFPDVLCYKHQIAKHADVKKIAVHQAQSSGDFTGFPILRLARVASPVPGRFMLMITNEDEGDIALALSKVEDPLWGSYEDPRTGNRYLTYNEDLPTEQDLQPFVTPPPPDVATLLRLCRDAAAHVKTLFQVTKVNFEPFPK